MLQRHHIPLRLQPPRAVSNLPDLVELLHLQQLPFSIQYNLARKELFNTHRIDRISVYYHDLRRFSFAFFPLDFTLSTFQASKRFSSHTPSPKVPENHLLASLGANSKSRSTAQTASERCLNPTTKSSSLLSGIFGTSRILDRALHLDSDLYFREHLYSSYFLLHLFTGRSCACIITFSSSVWSLVA